MSRCHGMGHATAAGTVRPCGEEGVVHIKLRKEGRAICGADGIAMTPAVVRGTSPPPCFCCDEMYRTYHAVRMIVMGYD